MACSVSRINQILHCDWLPERARWRYLACPLRPTRRVLHKKFPREPCNKPFTAQAYSAKMTGYWPRSFFASLWISADSDSIHTYNVQSSGLGLEIERELTFQSHVERLCIKKPSQRIGILKKIGHFLELKHRVLVYNDIIRSVMDYVSVILSNYPPSVQLFTKLRWISLFENA